MSAGYKNIDTVGIQTFNKPFRSVYRPVIVLNSKGIVQRLRIVTPIGGFACGNTLRIMGKVTAGSSSENSFYVKPLRTGGDSQSIGCIISCNYSCNSVSVWITIKSAAELPYTAYKCLCCIVPFSYERKVIRCVQADGVLNVVDTAGVDKNFSRILCYKTVNYFSPGGI